MQYGFFDSPLPYNKALYVPSNFYSVSINFSSKFLN